MTKDDLLANGFRRYDPPRELSSAEDLFQLRVSDENGIRYFISAECFRGHEAIPEAWEADVYFNDGCVFHPRACVKVKAYPVTDWAAADLLKWADELWSRLAPNYYERWK